MSKAYSKDIRRSIKKGWRRFLSIVIITALGVGMLTGLYAACLDMYYSADSFFDEQNLFDIQILSTLGLTQEDVEALAQVDGIKAAEGVYSETVRTNIDGVRKTAEMTVLSPLGLSTPYLISGRLPTEKGEIAVTSKYLDASGKAIGETVTIEEDIEKGSGATGEKAQADTEKQDSADKDNIDLDMEMNWAEETPTFANTSYTITGVVTDPRDISGNGNVNAFRSTANADYTFFITAADADSDIFTVVYIILDDTQGMNSFSHEYKNAVQTAVGSIENRIKVQREKLRYNSVLTEARTKITDAEITMDEKFAEADKKFEDGWKEIIEGRWELADGEATLIDEQKDAERKIAEARAELESAKQELEDAEEEFWDGRARLEEGKAELEANAQRLNRAKQQVARERQQAEVEFAAAQEQLDEAQHRLDEARIQMESVILHLKSTFGGSLPEHEWSELVNASAALAVAGADDSDIAAGTAAESAALAAALQGQSPETDASLIAQVVQAALGMGKINGGQQVLDARKSAFTEQKSAALQQLTQAEAELAMGEAEIHSAREMIEAREEDIKEAWAELRKAKAELADGEATLNAEEIDAKRNIADAWAEIIDGKKELADGESELREQELEYADKKEEARQKLADAYAELADINMTTWYVQDRTSLDSYSSFTSDLASIEAVGKVFPVIFLAVAVLMSLTAMTRMVEEERGLIGTYKALGLSNAAIYRKYILFALLACLLGGLLGDLFGFVLMPKFISFILAEELYTLPWHYLRFDIPYGVGGVALFMVGIVGATVLACRHELAQMPATLMRPKAPRAGSRIFLECVPVIWNRLKFLNKVTVRNLFRYKKRLFMTVGGIMGCTALILCGFAIKDSISDLEPKQYENIYQYDLLAVAEDDKNDSFVRQLSADDNIEDYLNLRIESIKLINTHGKSEKVQLMVIPDGEAIDDYIRIMNPDGKKIDLNDEDVFITQNVALILNIQPGDTVFVQNMALVQHNATISGIAQNYLGNNVYMTQRLYESMFGEYTPNGVLAHLSDACVDPIAYAQALPDNDSVLSAVSIAALKRDFGFDLINAVVLLITAMAGGLAFVVLFTLSNTNISERVRELATIKVLGFYDNEVHQYVNKETMILTVAGILMGLPLGRFISGFLTAALKMPSIYFAVHIEPASYLISVVITLCFAVTVNWMTNHTLNRIDMVEALKSVE